MQTKPSRPQKARKKKPLPKVSKPEPLVDENEIAKHTPMQAGKALIGKDPNYVETVGLGNLQVTTVKGIKDDRDT
jgi:hypothetical protein